MYICMLTKAMYMQGTAGGCYFFHFENVVDFSTAHFIYSICCI